MNGLRERERERELWALDEDVMSQRRGMLCQQ